jgi:sugar/nucleoside kinase (ribokinase family)
MFEKIFGGSGQEWKKILALHRYISSSEKELQTIFAEDDKNAP